MPQSFRTHNSAAWRWLKRFIASLLGIAALLKTLTSTQILASDGLLSATVLLFTVIGLEVALVVYLLTATSRRAWLATMATFSLFVPVALYALIFGRDCNCFGSSMGAELTLPLDMVILTLAWWFRPVPVDVSSLPVLHQVPVAVVTGLLSAVGAFGFYQMESRPDNPAYLLADSIINERWPISGRSHSALQPLDRGEWLILVVRVDCDHCRELVRTCFSDPQRQPSGLRTVVFLAGETDWPFQLDHVSLQISHAQAVTWLNEPPFVASPAVFVLRDGIVVDAADGRDSDQLLEELFGPTPPPDSAGATVP